jgi:glycogen synthase
MRILFAITETCDLVQVGGLAAGSAALPRALLLADIRIVVPGCPQVRRGLHRRQLASVRWPSILSSGQGARNRRHALLRGHVRRTLRAAWLAYGDERGVDCSGAA